MVYSLAIPADPVIRRVRNQAGAVIGVALVAAATASFLLARSVDAPHPERAVMVTLLVGMAGAVAILAGLAQREHYPHDRLGAANVITLLRGAGIALMAGMLVTPVQALGWGLAALAATLLALDGVDGWLARRARLQSVFGARFDVESDVAFALTLAALAVVLGHVGAWFLLIGLLRPLFLLAGWFVSALRAPLPDARWRRWVAGTQMGAQVLLITPLAAQPWGSVLAGLLLVGLVLSFAIDMRALIRQDREPCSD